MCSVSSEGVPAKNTSPVSFHEAGQTPYVDSTHWTGILKDIRDIREQLGEDTQPRPQPLPLQAGVQSSNYDLGFGHFPAMDLEEIMACLPARSVCDGLIFQYFNSRFTILRKTSLPILFSSLTTSAVLHPTKFQAEVRHHQLLPVSYLYSQYESFWDKPSETPIIWFGLLFAMLSLASSIHHISETPSASVPAPRNLSEMAKRCFVLGKYDEAKEHSLEALLVYVQTCYFRTKDTDVSFWFLVGIVIRLAIRMGYHRDPSKLPSGSALSPFESEMRRRVWCSIYQVDALISFQMGLPSMIPSTFCDTDLPSNIEYSDFGPESPVLPPPRPESDHTAILYTIAKNPVLEMFKKVVAHIQRLDSPPYLETMNLDRQLRDAYNNVPPVLQYKPIQRSFIDGPGVVMRRTTIEILHLKSIIILHRQYLAHRDLTYAPSRHACLEAALQVLRRQADLHEATQVGGHLHSDRWMISGLTANDFILAAMVVCLDLTLEMQFSGARTFELERDQGGFDSELLVEAIRKSQSVWAAVESYSAEAGIASRALESTVHKWNDHHASLPDSTVTATADEHAEGEAEDFPVEPMTEFGEPEQADLIDWVRDAKSISLVCS